MYKLAFLFYVGFVVLMSVMPSFGAGIKHSPDMMAHFAVYALMGCLGLFMVSTLCHKLTVLAGIIFLGMSIELVQHFIPGRTPSYEDIVANSLGVLFGIALFVVIKHKLVMYLKNL